MAYQIVDVTNNTIVVRWDIDGSLATFPILQDENGQFLKDDFIARCDELAEEKNNLITPASEAAIAAAKELLVSTAPSKPDCEKCARNRRRQFLFSTDFAVLADAPLTDEQKAQAIALRQELRDVPTQAGFPENVQWPDLRWLIGDETFQGIIDAQMQCSDDP